MRTLNILAAAAVALLAAGAAGAQEKWDLPAAYPANNYHSENLVAFAADVKKATGGKLDITVHAGASLFKAPEIKRAVQTGQVPIGEVLMVLLENEDAVFGADNVPFLATSFAESKRLGAASKPFIEKRLAAQGMRLLYWAPWPPQGLYAPKPINSVDDLKGLKFRSYGASAARFGELTSMAVTTVQAAEVAQAFATGKVNAMITSGATGFDTKIWEHVKYHYDTQAWLPKNMIIVNEAAFAKLDAATKAALTKAAADAEARGFKIAEEKTGYFIDQLKKNGMNVAPPSDKLKAELKKIGESMTSDWLKRAGADGEAIVAAFRKGS